MIDENLENIKFQYQNTELPQYLIYNGWADLKFKLPKQHSHFWKISLGKGLVFASICILATTAFISIAQASKPGDLLFPVKAFSENLRATVTGDYQQNIENRAQDVLDLSNKSQDRLDQAIEKYQQTVKESLEKTKNGQKSDQLNKTIEQNNQEIKRIEDRQFNRTNSIENNKSNGEVKGQKITETTNQDSKNNSDHNRQNINSEQSNNNDESKNKSD